MRPSGGDIQILSIPPMHASALRPSVILFLIRILNFETLRTKLPSRGESIKMLMKRRARKEERRVNFLQSVASSINGAEGSDDGRDFDTVWLEGDIPFLSTTE